MSKPDTVDHAVTEDELIDESLGSILARIDEDIVAGKVAPLSSDLVRRAVDLVGDVEVDINETIFEIVDL